METINIFDSFIKDPNQNELFKKLIKSGLCDERRAEAIVHALVDIAESFKKIYFVLIPEIKNSELDEELLKEKIWDIREEIRHIEYHLKDSSLSEL